MTWSLEQWEQWGWRMLMPALLFGGVAAGYVLLSILVLRCLGWWIHRRKAKWTWPGGSFWWVGYYALQVLGGLWSSNLDAWALSLEVKAALFVLPLLAAIPGRSMLRDFWWSLGWSVTAYLFWRCAFAGWQHVVFSDASFWRYARFAGDVHPTYLSLHAAAAWLGLGSQWGKERSLGLWLLLMALLAVSMGMMGSKAGILAAMVVTVLDIVTRNRWGPHSVRHSLGFSFLFLGLLGLSSYTMSKARFVEMKSVTAVAKEGGAVASSSSAGRLAVWSTALDVLVEHPLGVGTGDVTDELMTHYERDGIVYAAERRLNPHNQWLQAGVAFGWPGVVLISLAMGAWCWAGWRSRNRWLFLTGSLLMAHAMVESVLEVQRGVVFVMWMFVALRSSQKED